MATISKITATTITATGLTGGTTYYIFTSPRPADGYDLKKTFTTPPGATTFSVTYSVTNKFYAAIKDAPTPLPNSGTQYIVSTGSNGADGPSGPSGVTGPSGPSGAPSTVQGPSGFTGPSGPSGAPSTVQGPSGVTGPSGPSGAPSTVIGPSGVTGPSGASGPSGAPSTVIGPSGVTGPSGPSGSVALGGVSVPTGPSSFTVFTANSPTFFNLTLSSFTGFVVSGANPTVTGTYNVLRNNSGSYLSMTPTAAGGGGVSGISNPLVIPPGTSSNIVWNAGTSSYVMF